MFRRVSEIRPAAEATSSLSTLLNGTGATKLADDPSSSSGRDREAFWSSLRHPVGASSTLDPIASVNGQISHSTPPSGAPLPAHIFCRGWSDRRYSDITVIAFGTKYPLHRLILDQAPFFRNALSGPWLESRADEITLHPEETDSNMTQLAFELILKRLYGADISREVDDEAIGLFATGTWLEIPEIVNISVESLLRQMSPWNLSPLIRLVTTNYYGSGGDRILASAKCMLCRDGWEMPLKYWDGIPGDVLREIVGGDGFYVPGEWDRWVLAKRILDRRLRHHAYELGIAERGTWPLPKAPPASAVLLVRLDPIYRRNISTSAPSTSVVQSSLYFFVQANVETSVTSDTLQLWLALYTSPDIEPVLVLLDEGIHYVHFSYEQLEFVKKSQDLFGLPMVPDKIVSDALWQQIGLRQKIVNADKKSEDAGLLQLTTTNSTSSGGSSKGKEKASTAMDDSDDAQAHLSASTEDRSMTKRKFWVPTLDCTLTLGHGSNGAGGASYATQRQAINLSATLQPKDLQWATDFASSVSTFANPNTRADAGTCTPHMTRIAFTEYPPFRFSVEFTRPLDWQEGDKIYSRTVYYAGSYWNIYIQKVVSTRHTEQLGVYLHRTKDGDGNDGSLNSGVSEEHTMSVSECTNMLQWEIRRRGLPRPSQVVGGYRESEVGGDSGIQIGERAPVAEPAASNRMAPNDSRPRQKENRTDVHAISENFESSDSEWDSLASAHADPFTAPKPSKPRKPAVPPYVDARPTIRAWFKIYSPVKGGRMLSVYESAPDRFNFSLSWGWKSSNLMATEGEEAGLNVEAEMDSPPHGRDQGSTHHRTDDGSPKSAKLRFMVAIGVL